jgi:hypothetical protein
MERLGTVRRDVRAPAFALRVVRRGGSDRRRGGTGRRTAPAHVVVRAASAGRPQDRDALAFLYLDDGHLAAHVATRGIAERLMGEVTSRLGSAATLVETRPTLPVRIHSRFDSSLRSLASCHRRATAKVDDRKLRGAHPMTTASHHCRGSALCGRRKLLAGVCDRQTVFAEMLFRKQTELFGLFFERNFGTLAPPWSSGL